MRNKVAMGLVSFALIGFSANAVEALPKSGELQLQSINRGTSMNKYNDDYTHGTVTGVTFNATGTGLLHMSKTNCSFSVFTHKDINKISGFCAHEDKEGDKLFIQYAGNSNGTGEWAGTDDIIGGTGKFQGATGSGPHNCSGTHQEGEFPCTSKLHYQLR